MKRIHNTNEILDLNKKYEQEIQNKPRGLWYSINNEWLDWCKYEMPHWIKDKNFHIILDIKDFIIIKNYKELINFYEKYKDKKEKLYLNWNKISKRYKGIEIRNYYDIKQRMFDNIKSYEFMSAFYSWDVSSGCIWDLSCIKKIVKIT